MLSYAELLLATHCIFIVSTVGLEVWWGTDTGEQLPTFFCFQPHWHCPNFSLRVTRLFVRGRPTLPMPFVPDVGHKDPQCRQAQTRAKTANVRHEQLAAKGLPVTILFYIIIFEPRGGFAANNIRPVQTHTQFMHTFTTIIRIHTYIYTYTYTYTIVYIYVCIVNFQMNPACNSTWSDVSSMRHCSRWTPDISGHLSSSEICKTGCCLLPLAPFDHCDLVRPSVCCKHYGQLAAEPWHAGLRPLRWRCFWVQLDTFRDRCRREEMVTECRWFGWSRS